MDLSEMRSLESRMFALEPPYIRLLRSVRALLGNPNRWCQGKDTRVYDGRRQFCVFGALNFAQTAGGFSNVDGIMAYSAVNALLSSGITAMLYNDAIGRKHEHMIGLLDRAIEASIVDERLREIA